MSKPTLPAALRAWTSDAFAATLHTELQALGKAVLPLHLGTCQGGYVDDADLAFSLLACRDLGAGVEARLGCFFTEIVINCGCGADPMPVNAYCELRVRIDKASAEAEFSLLDGGEAD